MEFENFESKKERN